MKGKGYIKYKGEAMTLSFKYYPCQLNSVENPSWTGGPEESHLLPHSLCIFHSFLSFQHLQEDHFSMQISSAFSENSILLCFHTSSPWRPILFLSDCLSANDDFIFIILSWTEICVSDLNCLEVSSGWFHTCVCFFFF